MQEEGAGEVRSYCCYEFSRNTVCQQWHIAQQMWKRQCCTSSSPVISQELILPELKLSFFWRLSESVLGDAELFLVLLVQLDALLEAVDKLGVRQLPQPLDRASRDERATRPDELVGDLDEQRREALGRVVVRRDAVDDAHRADESRQHVHQRILQPHPRIHSTQRRDATRNNKLSRLEAV